MEVRENIKGLQGGYLIPGRFINLCFKRSIILRFLRNCKNVTDLPLQRSDSEPGVDTVGICVENRYSRNREFLIWIQFDCMTLGENGYIPLLLEDLMISESSLPEERASHHFKCVL